MTAWTRNPGFGIRNSDGHAAVAAGAAVQALPNPQSHTPNPLASEGGEP